MVWFPWLKTLFLTLSCQVLSFFPPWEKKEIFFSPLPFQSELFLHQICLELLNLSIVCPRKMCLHKKWLQTINQMNKKRRETFTWNFLCHFFRMSTPVSRYVLFVLVLFEFFCWLVLIPQLPLLNFESKDNINICTRNVGLWGF